jgi:hypothetical protein
MSGGYRNLTGATLLVDLLYKLNVVDKPIKDSAHMGIICSAFGVSYKKEK